jgi:hypothetical protein
MPVHCISSEKRRQTGQIFKKINAEDDGLTIPQRFNLEIVPLLLVDIMGPEPIPSLMIEIN